ncbi:N-formylglutamate amidohydrolase [Brevundimonas goettingensis]|uniref:N-formylglutamate amidohydrolase n=1 Tax=Brevundimonas goettingensis TaxID=2774190 RepID=UPI001A9CCB50|nr:N-formylglutamate amidohydrolase [Brevundimonas goettingensis]
MSLVNPTGASPFLLIGDHAGRALPEALGDLGLSEEDRVRHIAWDIGVRALGEALAQRLDAVFIAQTWSRLVVDCNRDPARADAIPEVSDGSPIPGNVGLTPADRAARIAEVHAPYQDAIAAELARRAGRETVLVALHSFTPRMQGTDRPWDAGVLHDRGDLTFAHAMLAILQAAPGLTIGDNEPYKMDGIDHTVPRHAFAARLPYVELEIRQDHLSTDAGVMLWADRIADGLRSALASLA